MASGFGIALTRALDLAFAVSGAGAAGTTCNLGGWLNASGYTSALERGSIPLAKLVQGEEVAPVGE